MLEFEFRKNVVEMKDRTFFNLTFRDNRGLLGLKLSATVHHFEVTQTNISGMFIVEQTTSEYENRVHLNPTKVNINLNEATCAVTQSPHFQQNWET